MSDKQRYSFTRIPEEFYYEFFSEGPKGKIKKVIRYRLMEEFSGKVYNLGFGDWNEQINDIDDRVNSNNSDRQKVLITVADTITDFTNHYPDAIIFVQGSTPSRTRLYQMGISNFWGDINHLFTIVGYVKEDWKTFEKGVNYEAFLILKHR